MYVLWITASNRFSSDLNYASKKIQEDADTQMQNKKRPE